MNRIAQQTLRVFLSISLLLTSFPGTSIRTLSFSQQDQNKPPEASKEGPGQQDSDTVVRPKKEAPPKKKRLTPKKPTGDKPDENFTLSVDIDLVNLDVSVTDKRGNFIPNLNQKNFRVYEDKVEQKITNFSPTTAPLTVVMLLEFASTFGTYFDDVVRPAAQFVEMLRPEDWAAVVAYDL